MSKSVVFTSRIFKACIISALFFSSVLSAEQLLPMRSNQVRTVRAGFPQYPGYHHLDENGNKSGYGYEILQEIAKYTNFKFIFTGADESWNKNIEMLETGAIDVLPFIAENAQFPHTYLLTEETIASFPVNMYVRRNDIRFSSENYPYFNNIKIGMASINMIHDTVKSFADRKEFTWQPVFFKTTDEAVDALLLTNSVDAVVSTVMPLKENQRMLTEIARTDFHIAVSSHNKELVDELNAALKKAAVYNPVLKTQLYAKYFGSGSGTSFHLEDEEEKFIEDAVKRRKAFTVLIRPDNYPLAAVRNGEPEGIASEIMDEISKRTNLTFKVIETASTAEYEKKAAEGAADIIFDARSDYNWAEKNGYKLTSPYLSMNISGIMLRSRVSSSEKTALPEVGRPFTKKIEEQFGFKEIVFYDTPADCAQAVISGEVQSAILDSFTSGYFINNDPFARFTEFSAPNLKTSLCIAVNEKVSNSLLLILNKSVLGLEQNTMHHIIMHQTSSNDRDKSALWVLYRYPGRFLSFFLLFAAALTVILVLAVKDSERRKRMLILTDAAQFGAVVCQIFDDVSEWAMTADTSTRIAFVNSRVIRETDIIPLHNLIHATSRNIVHPDDRLRFDAFTNREHLSYLASSRHNAYNEFRMLESISDEGGTYRWKSYSIHGMVKGSHQPPSVLVCIKDIDKIKHEEEEKNTQIREALSYMEKANKAKGEFMSRMSHEIRTPLNAVIGFLALVKRRADKTSQEFSYIQKAEYASRHLLSIINDILDMSAIESGRVKVAHECFNFRQFIESISNIYYSQAQLKDIHFEVLFTTTTEEFICGDQRRLTQVLMNLLSNAVKFTPKNGSVSMKITQKLVKNNTVHIRFDIIDNGPGMTKEFMEKIGTPFEQQSQEIGLQFGGSGLGVSISKNLVSMMNGVMHIESEIGKGSTFSVELPFDIDKTRSGSLQRIESFSGIRALVVDNDRITCEYETMLLEQCGIEAQYSLYGEEAVQIVLQSQQNQKMFNICLIDWKMPDMDGIETARRIRASVPQNTPIIIVTAYDFSSIEKDAREAGVTHFLSKPMFQSTLLNLLLEIFGKYTVQSSAQNAAPDFIGKRLLLAEDNEFNMEIAAGILSEAGFIVEKTVNGAEALAQYEKSAEGYYDAVILDVQMPVMNGHEAARRIRAAGRQDSSIIPVIAMTANAFPEDVSEALACGMNDHITKPIDIDVLFSVLAKFILKEK